MGQFNNDRVDGIYTRTILDHYRNSPHKITIDNPDIEFDEYNPICGDRVFLQLKLSGLKILKAGFSGEGCIITQASASLMIDNLIGKTLGDAEATSLRVKVMLSSDNLSDIETGLLGNLATLRSVRQVPIRIKCALLAWSALEQGIQRYSRGVPSSDILY